MKRKQRQLICCFFLFVAMFCLPKEAKVKGAVKENYTEITAPAFSYFEDFLSYLKNGGSFQYNQSYVGIDEKRYIKVSVKKGGTLMLTDLSEQMHNLTVLNQSKKKIGTFNADDSFLQLKTTPGDYYIQLPKEKRTITLTAMIYTDHLSNIKKEKTSLQSGTGSYVSHSFSLSKRKIVVFEICSVMNGKHPIYAYIEKWNGKKWVKVTKRATFKGSSSSDMLYGLDKGRYRIKTKTAKNQGFTMQYHLYKDTGTYRYKKSKASRLKNNVAKNQLVTILQKKARWYRIQRKSLKKKHYLNLSFDINTSDLKVYIYKKGRKKPIQKVTLKQGKKNKTKKIRLRYGTGTYYVKVVKAKKHANGHYYIYYSIE
ncbi:MAG: hypothetical protein PHT76_02295 [Anaerostipes sp.]|nr:hypothetical protein [Anaerostipes sp.]